MSTSLTSSAAAVRRSTGLRRLALKLWRAMEAAGQRRAERQLRQFAALRGDRFPELARSVAAGSSPEGV